MKSRAVKKIVSLALSCCLALILCVGIVGCGDTKAVYDNDTDPLTMSILEVDKVFNPFFSTSGTDSSVVGLTQLSMLGNDKKGKPVYGDSEATIVKDMQIVEEGTGNNKTSTYYFVLKNNLVFSNGSPLTIRDVLFNFYVYLDNMYTGASTIYSTDIVGLKEYRTNSRNENEQDAFMLEYQNRATSRINYLLQAKSAIYDEHDNYVESVDKFREYLVNYKDTHSEIFKHIVDDFDKTVELFKEEIDADWSNSLNAYEDESFTDRQGNVYKPFSTDVEMFLYNEGLISWNRNDAKLESKLTNDVAELKNYTEAQAKQAAIDDNLPDNLDMILQYWNTSVNLHTFLTNQELEKDSENADFDIKNISGIKFANKDAAVTVNGKSYPVPTHNADHSVASGHEVLSIKINGVDPKAIWNFAIPVAPMYYYSNAEEIAKFDFEEHFGVVRNSQTFMEKVVNDPTKTGVPVGAGPYVASKMSGGTSDVGPGDFCDKGVIYYERNDKYILGAPKIKKLRYQVVASNSMTNVLYSGEVDFVEPTAKPETVTELNNKKSEGYENENIQTSGYGYIGINAAKVPSLYVRQAIMHSINTQEVVDYYQGTAEAIHRSMSLSSWAYPSDATPYYPYINGPVPQNLNVVNPAYKEFVTKKGKKAGDTFTTAEQNEFIRYLVEDLGGYTEGSEGIYVNGSDKLDYLFTIAGNETDHPAYRAMYHATEILNRNKFKTRVTTDGTALSKLATGDLTVWAAAWGSTIDPDMYQVYHMDSKASSVKNWGYPQIKQNAGGKYDIEYEILLELAELIEKGRESNDQTERERTYKSALNLVMQLAIELPTYQRDDLFAYNANKIDDSSFTPKEDRSPYRGLMYNTHLVSLVTER